MLFHGHLTDSEGVTMDGVRVDGSHTICRRINHEKLILSYNRLPLNGYPLMRIVQLEASIPLPKGGMTSLNWPHIHRGRSLTENLDIDFEIKRLNFSELAKEFGATANIQFVPELTRFDYFILKP